MKKFNEYGEELITVYYVADDFMGQHGNTIEEAEIPENDYLYFKQNGVGGSMFLTYIEAVAYTQD